jgi:hypothetical protein
MPAHNSAPNRPGSRSVMVELFEGAPAGLSDTAAQRRLALRHFRFGRLCVEFRFRVGWLDRINRIKQNSWDREACGTRFGKELVERSPSPWPSPPRRGNRYGGRPQELRGLRSFAGKVLETSKLHNPSSREDPMFDLQTSKRLPFVSMPGIRISPAGCRSRAAR